MWLLHCKSVCVCVCVCVCVLLCNPILAFAMENLYKPIPAHNVFTQTPIYKCIGKYIYLHTIIYIYIYIYRHRERPNVQ